MPSALDQNWTGASNFFATWATCRQEEHAVWHVFVSMCVYIYIYRLCASGPDETRLYSNKIISKVGSAAKIYFTICLPLRHEIQTRRARRGEMAGNRERLEGKKDEEEGGGEREVFCSRLEARRLVEKESGFARRWHHSL
jgi:hypothetical protein